MVKAVIFDCFGVIITDSLKLIVSELSQSNPHAAREIMDAIHAVNRGLIEPGESNARIAEILGITVAEWRQRVDSGEVKDEQLLSYILELRKTYKTAMLSNISRPSLERRFSEEELRKHFDAVIVSGELGIVKPDAAIFRHAASKLGVEPQECVMIDDRETHCAGAVAVGMQAILYEDFEQMKTELERIIKANE